MRRKPSGGGYNNNQHRRPQRYQNGGGEHRQQGSYQQSGRGPRRNYGAAREKSLNQAREALAAGDRVLAENYFQHADHCYRMMVEEGQLRPNYTPPPAQGDAGAQGNGDAVVSAPSEEFIPENTNALPAFITANPTQPQDNPVDPTTIQNWEERDA